MEVTRGERFALPTIEQLSGDEYNESDEIMESSNDEEEDDSPKYEFNMGYCVTIDMTDSR